jgi:hypothetical protein
VAPLYGSSAERTLLAVFRRSRVPLKCVDDDHWWYLEDVQSGENACNVREMRDEKYLSAGGWWVMDVWWLWGCLGAW